MRTMSEVSDAFAVAALRVWFEANRDRFAQSGASSEYKDSGYRSASVRLETKTHLIEACAWDHASCLDTQILSLETGESLFPHVGHCDSKSEFESHLQYLIDWYVSESADDTLASR